MYLVLLVHGKVFTRVTMLSTIFLGLALAVTSLAQAPEGHRTVYITSAQDTKFVVVPKPRTTGATLVVLVPVKHAAHIKFVKQS
jgi:hypothetical protein